MRIIGGAWKGRKIQIPSKGWPVRPTTDFAREALFNILENRIDFSEIAALDLFGGTGMITLELYSRGCTDLTYVDRYNASATWMRSFAREHDLPVKVEKQDVFTFIKNTGRRWSFIFADPPYDLINLSSLPELIFSRNMLEEEGCFVLEHAAGRNFTDFPGFLEARTYGQSVFSFFVRGS